MCGWRKKKLKRIERYEGGKINIFLEINEQQTYFIFN